MFGSIHIIIARDMSMHISTDANLLQSPFEEVIDVDLIQGKTVKIGSTDSYVTQNYKSCKSCDNVRVVKNLLSCNNILNRLLNMKKVPLTFI